MKFEFIEQNEWTKVYDNGSYLLCIEENNKFYLKEKGEYIPSLYLEYKLGKVVDIKIQTTSYGSKSTHEIEKIIEGYRLAIDTIKEIKTILIDGSLAI